uniref:Uncharacterized protein n=1 Tax=Arion vulgaris TaxID=1028688 RepID=A0A0B7A338_9EUPU
MPKAATKSPTTCCPPFSECANHKNRKAFQIKFTAYSVTPSTSQKLYKEIGFYKSNHVDKSVNNCSHKQTTLQDHNGMPAFMLDLKVQ